MKRLLITLGVAALLALDGCKAKEVVASVSDTRDLCATPTSFTPETIATAKTGMIPNPSQPLVDSINANVGLADCLSKRAYLARRLSEPMEGVAKAVVAQCSTEAGAAQAAKHQLPHPADIDSQVAERQSDEADESREALSDVASFRECAHGVAQP